MGSVKMKLLSTQISPLRQLCTDFMNHIRMEEALGCMCVSVCVRGVCKKPHTSNTWCESVCYRDAESDSKHREGCQPLNPGKHKQSILIVSLQLMLFLTVSTALFMMVQFGSSSFICSVFLVFNVILCRSLLYDVWVCVCDSKGTGGLHLTL